jgi:hypothetical protein
MFRIQYLADTRHEYQPAARHATRGRVWIDICKPVRRLAVAEQIQRRAMIDKNAFVRVRQVEA